MTDNKDNKLVKVNEEKKAFSFEENKFVFYTALFYSLGLFMGSYFYKLAQSDKLDNLVKIKDGSFLLLLVSSFCLYFSVFLISSFLGFCLIGKPIINVIPILIGMGTGIRLAYYFISSASKGVGYSLIMIVPYTALFVTVISYTINNSNCLSTRLVLLTKGEGDKNFELSPYLKKYLIYSLLIALAALLDSALTKLLFSVVTI